MVVDTSAHPVALDTTIGLSLAPMSTWRRATPAPQPAQRRGPPLRWSGRSTYALGDSVLAISPIPPGGWDRCGIWATHGHLRRLPECGTLPQCYEGIYPCRRGRR